MFLLLILVLRCLAYEIQYPDLQDIKEKYSRYMTKEQWNAKSNFHVYEYNQRRCQSPNIYDFNNGCQKYCENYYRYVPSLPYKNARSFNKKTGYCDSQPLCPKKINVRYDEKRNICFDIISGMEVPGEDAEPIQQSQYDIYITFYCAFGKVGTFYGVQECFCDLGFTSINRAGFAKNEYDGLPALHVRQCDQPTSIYYYFPNRWRIYYDPYLDNKFPRFYYSNYWSMALIYYAKKLKYAVTTFFVPWEVEIVTFLIPQEQWIGPKEIMIMIWAGTVVLLVLLITLFQKYRQGISERDLMMNQGL